MDTKLRLIEILEEYKNGIHLREISRILKTGLPNVSRYVLMLEKEGVIKKEKYANALKIRLKKSEKTVAYLKQVNTEKFLRLPKRIQIAIHDFLDSLEIKPLIVLIFGSYAKNNFNENSDIDLLLVYQKVENEKNIENNAKRIGTRNNLEINPIYINYQNFERNFLDKNHDFSKEIREKAIVLFGIELYYSLLWRFLE